VKIAQEESSKIIAEINAYRVRYEDMLLGLTGGENMLEKKTIKFDRKELYTEIWERSLSKVAKKYDIQYSKLKEACEKSNIPLPTQAYWSSLYSDKKVEKTPLPEAENGDVEIIFSVRVLDVVKPAANNAHTEEQPTTTINGAGGNVYKRDTLYKEVWAKPVTKVAEKYGVSDVMIHKICKKLQVPVPPRGYWARINVGQKLSKEPLPEFDGSKVIYGAKSPDSQHIENITDVNEMLNFLSQAERDIIIKVAEEMHPLANEHKLHQVLLRYKNINKEWKKTHPRDENADWHRGWYGKDDNEPALWEHVSEQTLPRAYLILDCLYNTIESLGGQIKDVLSVVIRGELVTFEITEKKIKVPHVMTKNELRQLEEYEKEKLRSSYAYEPRFRKYDYVSSGQLSCIAYKGRHIKDNETSILENKLGTILIDLYRQSEVERIGREKREEEQRQKAEAERLAEIRRERYNEEFDRLQALINESNDYERACRIRNYADAFETKSELTAEEKRYIAWARTKADWFDPTKDYEDSIFGKLEHRKDDKGKLPEKHEPRGWW
jgi:hypothetical protein